MNLHLAALPMALTLFLAAAAEHAKDLTEPAPQTALPDFNTGSATLTGRIASAGSDTMNTLMTLWAETLMRAHPGLEFDVQGQGSATALPALIAGTADFGAMSRPLSREEVAVFKAHFGHAPVRVPVAVDLLAIYVHVENPLRQLTLPQIDAIFSDTRRGGLDEPIVTWGQLHAEGPWAELPIRCHGRNRASGTYEYLRTHALFGGRYRDSLRMAPSSSAVVAAIARDKTAIGFSGIGYRTEGVKALAIATDGNSPYIEPSMDAEQAVNYPLARFLYIVTAPAKDGNLNAQQREFLRLVLSEPGQSIVQEQGFVPVAPSRIRELRKTLALD